MLPALCEQSFSSCLQLASQKPAAACARPREKEKMKSDWQQECARPRIPAARDHAWPPTRLPRDSEKPSHRAARPAAGKAAVPQAPHARARRCLSQAAASARTARLRAHTTRPRLPDWPARQAGGATLGARALSTDPSTLHNLQLRPDRWTRSTMVHARLLTRHTHTRTGAADAGRSSVPGAAGRCHQPAHISVHTRGRTGGPAAAAAAVAAQSCAGLGSTGPSARPCSGARPRPWAHSPPQQLLGVVM